MAKGFKLFAIFSTFNAHQHLCFLYAIKSSLNIPIFVL